LFKVLFYRKEFRRENFFSFLNLIKIHSGHNKNGATTSAAATTSRLERTPAAGTAAAAAAFGPSCQVSAAAAGGQPFCGSACHKAALTAPAGSFSFFCRF
jgi:hypothetical protein